MSVAWKYDPPFPNPHTSPQKKKKKKRLWMQGEEEIFKDIPTCALAFRLLRKHGYDVSSGKSSTPFNQEIACNLTYLLGVVIKK